MKKEFKFSYSAPSQNERQTIESIKQQYMPKTKTELKIDKVKRLNNKVTGVPKIVALIFGIIGSLIFGLGLSMILEWNILIWGIAISIVGIILFSLAFPIYKITYKKLKNKYKDEILKLSNEILISDENI